MIEKYLIKPIGFVESYLKQRYEAPRQGILADKKISIINLYPHNNFEQALTFLDGFERIWVIYLFHLNKNWKPLVTPPRNNEKKVGVFASRAPYRPNHIGLSCVKLEKVEGLKIFISESDILDNTPVLDIKPYLPYSDSFPDAKTGWVKTDIRNIYAVQFSKNANALALKLLSEENINLIDYARIQLEFTPQDITRKRISVFVPDDLDTKQHNNLFCLSYRKWNIVYKINDKTKSVLVKNIFPKV